MPAIFKGLPTMDTAATTTTTATGTTMHQSAIDAVTVVIVATTNDKNACNSINMRRDRIYEHCNNDNNGAYKSISITVLAILAFGANVTLRKGTALAVTIAIPIVVIVMAVAAVVTVGAVMGAVTGPAAITVVNVLIAAPMVRVCKNKIIRCAAYLARDASSQPTTYTVCYERHWMVVDLVAGYNKKKGNLPGTLED